MSNLTQNYSDVLAHYGVRGMRWGIRKAKNSEQKLAEKNAKAAHKREAASDHKIAKELGKKPLHKLSNEELQKLNTRMNLEAQYQKLHPPTSKRARQKYDATIADLGRLEKGYQALNTPGAKMAIEYGQKALIKRKATKRAAQLGYNTVTRDVLKVAERAQRDALAKKAIKTAAKLGYSTADRAKLTYF